jgi:hypothetical protein
MANRLQINFEFSSTEDRLMMRISEKNADKCVEYRLWLTRRFVNIFLGAIEKLLEADLTADMQVPPESMDAMKKFRQDAALAKADFSTSYDGESTDCTLFGEKPILTTKLKVGKKSKGKYIISLFSEENTGVNLTASIDLVHAIRKTLIDAANRADWGKPLLVGNRYKVMDADKKKLDS